MTSLLAGIKQNQADLGYFMPVSSLQGIIYSITNGSGAGGSFLQAGFNVAGTATVQQAAWCLPSVAPYATNGNPYLSSINGAGAGLLKDMGRTVVSAGRTFRKVQLVSSIGAPGVYGYSNAGVGGAAATATDATGYFTGYIQLGVGGGRGAAVARV